MQPRVLASLACCERRGEQVVKDWIADNLDSGNVTKESLAGSSSWSSAYVYHTESGKKFFVKLSLGRDISMFKGEALGLQALYGTVLCLEQNLHALSRCCLRQLISPVTDVTPCSNMLCRHKINAYSQDPPFWRSVICARR